MKNLLLLILCLQFIGCVSLAENQKLQQKVTQLQGSLSENKKTLNNKESQIRYLKELLRHKDTELKDKNLKIEQLRKKLETFGVFEK